MKNKILRFIIAGFVVLNLSINLATSVHATEVEEFHYYNDGYLVNIVDDLNTLSDEEINSLKKELTDICKGYCNGKIGFEGWKYVDGRMGNMYIFVKAGGKYYNLNTGVVKNTDGKVFVSYISSYVKYDSLKEMADDINVNNMNLMR